MFLFELKIDCGSFFLFWKTNVGGVELVNPFVIFHRAMLAAPTFAVGPVMLAAGGRKIGR